MSALGFFGKRKARTSPLPIPDALSDDSFDQAFKPFAPQQDSPWQQGPKGGRAAQIIGVIGDALQSFGGGQPTYVPQLLDMQQQTDRERRQLEQFKMQRQANWEDFQRENQWKLDHTPADPPPIVRDARAFATMSPEERANLQQLEDIRNPIIRQGGDGLPYAYNRPPVAPVGKLTIIPGGGVGNGTGNFR